MEAKKFKLGLFSLGNGTTVCNTAVMKNGDYKMVAHIGNAGKITWCVDVDYIPEGDMEKLVALSKLYRRDAEENFNRLSASDQYYKLMQNDAVFIKFMNVGMEKFDEMKEYYFSII